MICTGFVRTILAHLLFIIDFKMKIQSKLSNKTGSFFVIVKIW